MKKVLVVESPAKARKIQSFFKDGTICLASYGHIRDLDPKSLSVDVDRNFAPQYRISQGKSKLCQQIQAYATTHEIILAADDDREGDAIAWHCGQVANLDFAKDNRIVFHEISCTAIQRSLDAIHPLDMNSVNAQQARRVIDRLVGYSLSPLLWKHVQKGQKGQKGLSAGRVQSTLLSILWDHEQAIANFEPTKSLSCHGAFSFSDGEGVRKAKGGFRPSSRYEPPELLRTFSQDRDFVLSKQETSRETQASPCPLITSTLQQSSQKELHFSIKQTMDIAQKLYETGKITYMRTDSPRVSPEFQERVRDYVGHRWSPTLFQSFAQPSSKVKGAQEAHECIRVTFLDDTLHERYTENDKKLYELIKRYTVMAHMKPAIREVLRLSLTTDISRDYGEFQVSHKTLIDKGFLSYYDGTTQEYSLDICPTFSPDTSFRLETSVCSYEPSKPPSYHDESRIVRTLESSGIGRPSTYASIIGTLSTRNYTEVQTIEPHEYEVETYRLSESDTLSHEIETHLTKPQTHRIRLTDLGKRVLEYLLRHFSHILNVEFTARVEEDLDRIHAGQIEWVNVVRKVYDSFISEVILQKSLTRTASDSAKATKKENKEKEDPRLLGRYQGDPVYLHVGPYGPYLRYRGNNKSLKYLDASIEELSLRDVEDILKYPLKLGTHHRKSLVLQMGPYGKYLKYNGKNYRIPPSQTDPTLKECLSIISS